MWFTYNEIKVISSLNTSISSIIDLNGIVSVWDLCNKRTPEFKLFIDTDVGMWTGIFYVTALSIEC